MPIALKVQCLAREQMKQPKWLNPLLHLPTRIYRMPPLLYRHHSHFYRRGEFTVFFSSLLSRLFILHGTIPSPSVFRWIQSFFPIRLCFQYIALQGEPQSQGWPLLVCQVHEVCSQAYHSRSFSHLCCFMALLCPDACLLVRYIQG